MSLGQHDRQHDLFATPALPPGFVYRPSFLASDEETALLRIIAALPFEAARYRQWSARRRIVSYGGRYDFTHLRLDDAEPIPAFLDAVRERIASFVGLDSAHFQHATIAEYAPGTPLGWHRDVPDFEVIAGVSLAGTARMRFRPYPPSPGRAQGTRALDLEPRSAYVIRGRARWQWQHAISPTRTLRYSITFRTLAAIPPPRRPQAT